MIKCIVWDLDNTLWRGTLAEGDSPRLNAEAAETVETASRQGIIQSVASRNNEQDALRQLSLFGLDKFFLYPQINPYLIKSAAIGEIARHFNISADSVIFVDDEPFELYEVNRYLPQAVTCPAGEISRLRKQIEILDAPSGGRLEWMRAREARLAAESVFYGTRAAFLAECEMKLTVRKASEKDMPRVKELAARANKINNLPGNINFFSPDDYLRSPELFCCICELSDRFGEHGIVGAGLFRAKGTALHIDLFCISCRVEGRGIASAFLSAALDTALNAGARHYTGVYCRCARDGMTLTLLKSLGFKAAGKNGGIVTTRLDLPFKADFPSWIEVILL